MNDWIKSTLSEVCFLIARGVTPSYMEQNGLTVVNQRCIRGGIVQWEMSRFTDETRRRVSQEKYLQDFDILVNSTGVGTAGRVAQLKEIEFRATADSHVTIIRPNRNKIDPLFLGFVLKGRQSEIEAMAEGSTGQTEISRARIGELELFMPSRKEQAAIADLLGALDDKIELNRKMNETLESMARAIFKSWFVDFDPVRAKMEGRQPYGMDADTAALFPDSFEDSPLGKIPSGWGISTIGEVVNVVGGSTPSTKNPAFWDGGHINWATPKDLSSLKSPVLLDTDRRVTAQGLDRISSGLLPRGSVLLSSRAPIGYLAIADIPTAVNQGFIALVCDKGISNYYVLNWAQRNMDNIEGRANGTTFLEISKRNFRPIELVIPTSEVMDHFSEVAGSYYSKVISNLYQSRTLSELRDTLLPKLMSGEVRVHDIAQLESEPS